MQSRKLHGIPSHFLTRLPVFVHDMPCHGGMTATHLCGDKGTPAKLLCACGPQGDPYKTLFVARLSYDVTERRLQNEFEEFGPIKRIRLVHDKVSGMERCRSKQALFPKPTQTRSYSNSMGDAGSPSCLRIAALIPHILEGFWSGC